MPEPDWIGNVVIEITETEISAYCTGRRWTVSDLDLLARIIAIIAMGQAAHAAQIIAELLPAEPAINVEALRKDAIKTLSVLGDSDEKRKVAQYHRDGLIFEIISWVAAQQETGGQALLRDPHICSTTQGLDGLMIELNETKTEIERTTIFEDKCSENPRKMFRDNIMDAFLAYHKGSRSTALLTAAAALLETAGLRGTKAIEAAGRILNLEYRAYRGSLAITSEDNIPKQLNLLFKNYENLDGIGASQRIGSVLVTADDLRAWFSDLAERAITYIHHLGSGEG